MGVTFRKKCVVKCIYSISTINSLHGLTTIQHKHTPHSTPWGKQAQNILPAESNVICNHSNKQRDRGSVFNSPTAFWSPAALIEAKCSTTLCNVLPKVTPFMFWSTLSCPQVFWLHIIFRNRLRFRAVRPPFSFWSSTKLQKSSLHCCWRLAKNMLADIFSNIRKHSCFFHLNDVAVYDFTGVNKPQWLLPLTFSVAWSYKSRDTSFTWFPFCRRTKQYHLSPHQLTFTTHCNPEGALLHRANLKRKWWIQKRMLQQSMETH